MSNINYLNSQIEQYQKMWILANQRGDQHAMAQAHQQAEALRQQGGTIRADQDTAATRSLKQAVQTAGVHVTIKNYSVQQLNQGIVQAKLDYQYAQARGDRNAMQAASVLANNYRALGGTISANASLVDAQNQLRSSTVNNNARTPISNTVSLFYAGGGTENRARAFPQPNGSVVGTDDSGHQTVYVPSKNPNIQLLNSEVENDKLNYINAQVSGNNQSMNQASSDASYLRDLGATLGAGEETAATSALKNYYSNDPIIVAALNSKSTDALNKAIWKAKNDFTYAQQHNDEAGMKAAEALGANMRAMGGTIGADVSLQQAHDMVFGTSNHTTTSTTSTASTNPVDPSQTVLNNVWNAVQNFLGVDDIKKAWNTLIDPNSTPTQQSSAAATITFNLGLDVSMFFGVGDLAKGTQLLIKGASTYGKDLLAQTAEKEAAYTAEGATGKIDSTAGDASKVTEKAFWGSWNDYDHVEIEGQTYAKVGDRLYSKHAVDRMQPSWNRFGHSVTTAGGDYGRSVSPNYVDEVIKNTEGVHQANGNYSHTLGSLQVIVNNLGAVVTIIAK